VPKFAKPILIVCGAVLLIGAAGLLVANLYLQSEGVQTRIREAASKALGAPLAIRGTSFTPWGGFVLHGISVPDPERSDHNLLEAKSLRLHIATFPLFSGRLVIRQVTLSNPTIIARQSKDRRWTVLVPPPPQGDIPVTVPERTTTQVEAPRPARTMKVTVERIRVSGLTAVFVDAKGRTIFRAENGEGDAVLGEQDSSSGSFQISKMEIGRALKPKNFGGPFSWDGRVLDMPELGGTLAGGTISGKYRLEVGETSSFALDLGVTEARLKKLAGDLGGSSENAAGLVNASIQLAGDPGRTESIAGDAVVDMVGARFTPVDFIVQLGQLLGVEELQVLNLNEATSRFLIREGRVDVETIHLQSENLILAGTGTALFDGSIDIDGRLMVNRKLQRQLRALLGKNFKDADDPEYKQVAFEVTNTLADPRTDLLDKLIGVRVGDDVGGVLRNLFRVPAGKGD
jgi:hypothetical protein